MAHFAKIEDGTISEVIVVSNDVLDANGEFPESEASGQAFIASLSLKGEWLQASYRGSFRGNFPAIGFTYDEELDAFIPPKPGDNYVLDESTYSWIEVTDDED
jgi:hypothetical protein